MTRASTGQCHFKSIILTLLIAAWIVPRTYADSSQGVSSVPQKDNAAESMVPLSENRISDTVLANITDPCEGIYNDYMKAAGDFTHCELLNAKPFKLCTSCITEYAVVSFIYQDLLTNASLEFCKMWYTKSDRVQIIPTLQDNIETLWKNANCHGCYSNLHIDPVRRNVSYTKPKSLIEFERLYHNFTDCIDQSKAMVSGPSSLSNMSSLCRVCKDKYIKLNDHFDSVTDRWERDVCMDMAELMNSTRRLWNSNMNCTHRTADSTPVIIITVIVALTPCFFYGTLRITGKVRRKRIFQQKRLASSIDNATASGSSDGSSLGAGDFGTTPRQRLASFT